MEVDPPPPSQDDPSLVPSTSSGHGQMDQCPSEIQDNQEDFLQTGRVGRRNASKNHWAIFSLALNLFVSYSLAFPVSLFSFHESLLPCVCLCFLSLSPSLLCQYW